MGIQQSEERSQDIHLPIVSPSNKAYISLKGTTKKIQMNCNRSILHTSNAI